MRFSSLPNLQHHQINIERNFNGGQLLYINVCAKNLSYGLLF